ncbi:hypothetical protein HNQ91_001754 [Filimonas zeae]|uniref:Uncharacterized protein n=1 Tax=Filimonas zeae TaxID=1737353 RepID=A0A917J0F5_9BACT|nr:hypothetical protein [Filimonas zeae]MDR6338703.1 hypothetical protein [Filimonas zeae]GGH66983.1 hypothetical protein GCM10011379_21740 [Filimonas zeae]
MPAIKLNFINQSNDTNNSQIVIFQKTNSAGDIPAIAWTVIKNCGRDFTHPFEYPMSYQITATDSFGNTSPKLAANNGDQFSFVLEPSGHALHLLQEAGNPEAVTVANNLAEGAINAGIYKDGRLLAAIDRILPEEKASFSFTPTIWIGAVSQLEEGAVIDTAIAQQIDTEISLLGIQSADIIMRGGGSGPDAKPFTFNLENINYA